MKKRYLLQLFSSKRTFFVEIVQKRRTLKVFGGLLGRSRDEVMVVDEVVFCGRRTVTQIQTVFENLKFS